MKYDEVKFTRLKDSLFIDSKPLLGIMLRADVYLSDHPDALVKEEEELRTGEGSLSEGQSQTLKKKTAMSLIHKRAMMMARKTRGGERPSLLEVHHLLEEVALTPDYREQVGEDAVPSFEAALDNLLGDLLSGREWIAELHDLLGSRGVKRATVKDLQALLTEADTLPVTVPSEEALLRRVLKAAETLKQEARALLTSEEGKSREPMEKASIAAAEKIVQAAANLNVKVDSVSQVEEVLAEAVQLAQRVLVILGRVKLLQSTKRSSKTDLSPAYTITELEGLIRTCEACVLEVPNLTQLKALVADAYDWLAEVSLIENDEKNVVSLQRIESLFAKGERLPFVFEAEMDILQDKRNHARLWLDKLKKVFPSKGRQPSRKPGEPLGDESTNGKLHLADMRTLVQEGEILLQRDDEKSADSKSTKELTKAQTLVDAAEEWMGRVNELLADIDVKSIPVLQELLEEADEMPVYMEEIGLLQVHLDSLEWSVRAKKKIGASKLRQTELSKLVKELAKIRTGLPDRYRDAPLVVFEEEKFCVDALALVERWTGRVKRLMSQINNSNKEVDYGRLKELYLEGLQIPVNVEAELRPVLQALEDAEEWVAQNKYLLSKIGIKCTLERTNVKKKDVDFFVGSEPELANDHPGISDEIERKLLAVCAEGDSDVSNPLMAMDVVLPDELSSAVVEMELKEESKEDVELLHLDRLADSASHLLLTFPEIAELRGKISEVRRWMEEINALCPRKLLQVAFSSRRKGSYRAKRMTASNLEELLARGSTLGVNVDRELTRVSELVEASKLYNETCKVSLETISSRLQTVLESTIQMAKNGGLELPYRKGTIFKSPGLNSKAVEESNFASFLAVQTELLELQKAGEDSVLFSTEAAKVDICVGICKWIVGARGLLLKDSWGDCTHEEVENLAADIKSLLQEDR